MQRALIIYVPSRTGIGARHMPLGPLAVASILNKSGVDVRIHDLLDGDTPDVLKLVGEYGPDIIGYSGIASSYPRAKEVSHAVRSEFKDIIHLAGGPLASTFELLLQKKVADYVVHGEAEVSLPKLVSFLKGERGLDGIGGISHLSNGRIERSGPEEQIKDLDSCEMPAYHLIDVPRYLESLIDFRKQVSFSLSANRASWDIRDRMDSFIARGKDKYILITSSRGCTHACLFCYRHVRGVRRHSVDYVIKHIKFLREKYGIGGVLFGDELLNSDLKWLYDLCDAIESEFKGDFFYKAGSARADKIDRQILARIKDTGGIDIAYGLETGSPKILKEYRKGVTVERNIEATLMTKEVGLITYAQLVIGSPSETTGTILETLRFLKKVDAFYDMTGVNYLIPMPETPIWKYVTENKLITDVEAYLERVARYGGTFEFGLNLTKSNKFVWKFWSALIYRRVFLNEAAYKKNVFSYVYNFFFGKVIALFVSKRLKRFFSGLFGGR